LKQLDMSIRVASVTVAYNSARLLPKQLDSLLRQTRPLDEIIVVNNDSTDDTLAILERYPKVTVLNLPANVGTGGGYAAGLAYAALEKKHDWVWLLDHDSVPQCDGLETLLQALSLIEDETENTGILASSPLIAGTLLTYPSLLWERGLRPPSSATLMQPVCFVDAVISSGSLIRRRVVEDIGLPREDFFIDFVDFEYCLRLRRHNY